MKEKLSIEDVNSGIRQYVPDLDDLMDEKVKAVVDFLIESYVLEYNMRCVNNAGCVDLEIGKDYKRIPSDEADGMVRIVDDSGCDYLYPSSFFREDFLTIPVDAEMVDLIMRSLSFCYSEGISAVELSEETENRLVRVLHAVYPEVVGRYDWMLSVKKLVEGKE